MSTREGPSGRASPGGWGNEESKQSAPGRPPAPGGREPGGERGSMVFEVDGPASAPRPLQFHELTHDDTLQQPAWPEATGLPLGDTGTMAGSNGLRSSTPSTIDEVFRRALGTMMCENKMRSNMGEAAVVGGDLMPLPVPQDDLRLAATVASLNLLGGWNSRPPGVVTSDLQRSALKNLSELLGTWHVACW